MFFLSPLYLLNVYFTAKKLFENEICLRQPYSVIFDDFGFLIAISLYVYRR